MEENKPNISINEEQKFMEVIDENGNAIQYDVLFLFEDTQLGVDYIVYVDKYTDEKEEKRLFVSEMKRKNDRIILNDSLTERGELIAASLIEAIKEIA